MAENAISKNSIEISPATDDFGLLCVCAIRFSLGQREEISQKVVAFVEKHLPAMSTDTLNSILKSIQEHIYFGGMSSLGDSDNAKMWLDFSDKIEEILKEHEPKSDIKIENNAAYILLQSDTKILLLEKDPESKEKEVWLEKGSGIHVDVEGKVQIPLPTPTQMNDWYDVAQNQFPLQNEPVIACCEDEFFASGTSVWSKDVGRGYYKNGIQWHNQMEICIRFYQERRKTPCFSYGDIRRSETKFLLKGLEQKST